MSKLAEQALRKIASNKSTEDDGHNPYLDVMDIKSGMGEDVSSLLLGSVATTPIGDLVGLLQSSKNIPTKEQLKEYNAASLLPGVTGARNVLRDRAIDEELSNGDVSRRAVITERLGSLLMPILMTGLVGGGAYLADKKFNEKLSNKLGLNSEDFAGFAGTSAGLLTALPWLVGFLRKRRNAEQHKDYLAGSPALLNLLVPGAAAHNLGRRNKMKWLARLSSH